MDCLVVGGVVVRLRPAALLQARNRVVFLLRYDFLAHLGRSGQVSGVQGRE